MKIEEFNENIYHLSSNEGFRGEVQVTKTGGVIKLLPTEYPDQIASRIEDVSCTLSFDEILTLADWVKRQQQPTMAEECNGWM